MAFMLRNLSKVYNIPSVKTQSYFDIRQSKPSIITNQYKSLSSFKYYPKHVSSTINNNNNKLLTIWPRSPSSSILSSSTHHHPYLNYNKNLMIFQRQQLQPQPIIIKRTFVWYRVPLMILTASDTKRKIILSGIIGGTALIGFILGPLSLLVMGGIAGIITIRLWRQTRDWWRYIPAVGNTLSNQSSSLYAMLRSQVGQHRAEDQVRNLAIEKIKHWAHTNQGRKIFLNEFNVDHVNDLTFLPNHATAIFTSASSINNDNQQNDLFKKQISIQFWVESEEREDSGGGGGCMVTVDANVNPNNGNVTFQQIKLAAPGWNVDEFVPLDNDHHHHHEKIIEGEFKNV